MRLFCDFSLNIVGIFPDDQEVDLPGCFEVNLPQNITVKREKTVSFARQKRDGSGKAIFAATDKNQPVMEQADFTRKVGLKDSASEWKLNEVLEEKYKLLFAGKDVWFEEFINDSAVDRSVSIVNTGIGAISVPAGGVLQLNAIQLSKSIKQFSLYIEGAVGLDVEYSVDAGINFTSVSLNLDTKLSKKTDTFVFRIKNANIEGTPSVVVRAIAISF